MKLKDAIAKIDKLKPNTFDVKEKIAWVSQLDSMIKKEIVKSDIVHGEYDIDSLDYIELFVESPYDDIYIYWLEAKIDYFNGEIGKYNNSMAMFNARYVDYERYYIRNHLPKPKNFKFW